MAESDDTLFPPGSKWVIKKTDRNLLNGLKPMESAFLTYVDGDFMSIVSLQPGMPQLRVPRAMFGWNFTRSIAGEVNSGYAGSRHAQTLYR